MVFKSRLYAAAALLSFVGLAPFASAQAGNLFPPENIGANPNISCPNGQLLGWTGNSVNCTNPTPGVTTTLCPAGQMLVGITGGSPDCAGVSVSCPAGEVLTGLTNGAANCVAMPVGTSTTTVDAPTTPALLPYPSSIICNINGTPISDSSSAPNPPMAVYFSDLQHGTYVYVPSSVPIIEAGTILASSGNTGSVVYDAFSGQLLNNSVTTMPGEGHGADNVYSITCPSTLP
jgi:hypothetical protein